MFTVLKKIYELYNSILSKVYTLVFRMIGIDVGARVDFRGFPHIFSRSYGKILIGDECKIHSSTVSNHVGLNHKVIIRTQLPEAEITIGNNVGISGSTILSRVAISIGDNTNIGANCFITDTDHHPIDPLERLSNSSKNIVNEPVSLGKNVWLAEGVKVLKGVSIGDNSIVGAGSVVVSSVPANVIAAGNPAKIIRDL